MNKIKVILLKANNKMATVFDSATDVPCQTCLQLASEKAHQFQRWDESV